MTLAPKLRYDDTRTIRSGGTVGIWPVLRTLSPGTEMVVGVLLNPRLLTSREKTSVILIDPPVKRTVAKLNSPVSVKPTFWKSTPPVES